jgi:hypothetical protein
MVKKVLVWGGLAFILFYIAFAPGTAAGVFKALGGGIMDIAQGLGDFFKSLVA